ncbi:uncharacterized protein B0H64DRAFT_329742 [Chaetomium fimeti]|uniref:Nephrocystin 3-like N-terminal domain-containing protein n=1 Tax=Chaetomium fimeti TaxID=1854472 RepID=A0AAE0HA44_9PEZI|nr:hypothetical protein B0H64DRAFT_329742 [Chaetomium fimeti]
MDLLLVSLIRQLASKCQGFRDNKSLKWFRSHQDSGELPDDTNELFNYLKKFISKVDKDVFIVLDGLDQVPERQRAAKTGPLKLLDIIKKLTRQGYPNLHILLVSRDEKDIRLCLETNMKDMLVSVDVKQQLGADLDNFVERKLEDMPILKGNQPLRQAVKKRLNHGHDGNFLWAASVLSQVSQSLDAEEIRDVLNKIPDNIVGMYQTALEKVAAKDTKRMKLILLWMLRQQRPLSQAELAAAVGLHSPSVVTDICTKVLIQTSKQSVVVAGQERDLDVFRFTHFSVQEYLEAVFVGSQEKLGTKLEKVDRFRFPLPADAHIQLTRRCLAILSACFSSQKDKAAITDDGPGSDSDASASGLDTSHGDVTAASSDAEDTDYLYGDWGSYTSTSSSIADSKCTEGPARRYAAEYWFHHYNMVDKRKASSRQIKDLDAEICSQLLLDNKKLRFWLKTYDPEGGKDEDVPSPVYYVVKLGLEGILAQIITQFGRPRNDTVDRKPILDWRGSEGTALQLAAHLGDSDALDALIEHGADVNSEKGLHGTALYASAARGDENAVKQLVDAGAVCTGTEDGPLGNPLHIAAFRGHDTVIRLLLDRDRVAVDHRADPFCTALQAASAARKHTTVKLLLDHDADPNIVGGWLGTAAQAASTHLGWPGNDDIVETLVAKKADFVTGPSFWSTAYKRASFRDEMGQELISKSYHSLLLQYRIPNSAGLHELQHPQRLLAVAICQWTLPADRLVNSDPVFKGLLCRVPFQDQLDAIRQAIPRLELTMQHVRHKDFLHKALFWSGINYILNRLPLLINQCLGQVRRQLRYEPEESARVHASPALPLRWAFKEFEDGYEPCYQDAWPRRSLISGFRMRNRRKQWRSPWGEDSRDQMSSLARSDLIAVDLMHRRQRHRHLEEALLTTSGYIDPGESGESRESAAHKELQLASEPGVWVMSDILDLVKDLLVYGDRCVRYQDAVSDATETAALGHRKRIEDLTFELFSVVIRLAFLVGGRIEAVDLQLLPDPVRLLTAVRLKRIKQLDAMCEQDFASKSPCGRAPADNHAGLKAQEIAAAVARQVEQSIEGKLASSRADMVREIQSQVSGVVKEEVSRLVGQMQQGLEEKMDEMQRQLAEVQETQARRGLLW